MTVGEAMLRLWVPPGERLEDAPAYRVTVAGAEANVAMAVARTGRRVAWLSRLPDSPLGRRAAREIAGHGVDVAHVVWDDTRRMGTYFVELSVPPRPVAVVYDRAGSAAAALAPADIAWDVVESATVVHLTGITAALSDGARAATFEVASRARAAGATVVVDVNYRSRLWPPDRAAAVTGELCRRATLVIVTHEDGCDLFDLSGTPSDVAAALRLRTGAEAVIVTAGGAGASWDTPAGADSAPGYRVAEAVDRIGAGDAFAAGVIIGLLGDGVAAGVRRGLAMAALKMGIYGDQLVVTQPEVDALLSADPEREVRR